MGRLYYMDTVSLQFFLRLMLDIFHLCEGDDNERNSGGAGVRRAQRPWDRAGGTKAGFRSGSPVPRWWRLETVTDSAVRIG